MTGTDTTLDRSTRSAGARIRLPAATPPIIGELLTHRRALHEETATLHAARKVITEAAATSGCAVDRSPGEAPESPRPALGALIAVLREIYDIEREIQLLREEMGRAAVPSSRLRQVARRQAAEAAARQTELRRQLETLATHAARGFRLHERARRELEEGFATNTAAIERALLGCPPEFAAWGHPNAWTAWSPDGEHRAGELRLGVLRDRSTGTELAVPVVAPLHVGAGPIVIASRGNDQREVARALVRSLVLRARICCPHRLDVVAVDLPRLDSIAIAAKHPADDVVTYDHADRMFDEVVGDISRIETTYLDAYDDMDAVPEPMRLGETRRLLAVMSFSTGFSDAMTSTLLSIIRRGPRAGVHTLLHLDLDSGPPPETFTALRLAGAVVIDIGQPATEIAGLDLDITWDGAPDRAVEDLVRHRLATIPPRDHPVLWDEVRPPASESGHEPVDHFLAAPIGKAGADLVYDIWLGEDVETGRRCEHGIVIGHRAVDRMAVYDTVLAGLAVSYSPADLGVYLVEGLHATSLAAWTDLPHADIVALTASAHQMRNILAEVRAEVQRRRDEFARRGLASYAAVRGTDERTFPRVIALIDGYEQLFADDVDGDAVNDLREILQHGGPTGVHLILGGSRFDSAAPLHHAGLFELIQLRVALQLASDDHVGPDEFGLRGNRLIHRICDRPGRAVVNSSSGHDDANLGMQLAWLSPAQRDLLIAHVRGQVDAIIAPLVLRGADPPSISDNAPLRRLLHDPSTKGPAAVERFARASGSIGGLGIDDWNRDDPPLVLFVGPEESTGGQAVVLLRRQPMHNLALIMADRDLRAGTLASILVSSLAIETRAGVEYWIADRTAPGTASSDLLDRCTRQIEHLGHVVRHEHAESAGAALIRAAADEVSYRRDRDEHRATILVVVSEPEHLRALNRVPTAHGETDSGLGSALTFVLAQGPSVGIHVVIAASSRSTLRTAVGDLALHQFVQYRLVTRLPEEDSFSLVRSRRAAILAGGDRVPPSALLFDAAANRAVVFRPYSAARSTTRRRRDLAEQIVDLLEPLSPPASRPERDPVVAQRS